MEISREDQIEFAKEILILIEESGENPEQLDHLRKLVSLLVSWVGKDNGVAVVLSEYTGELAELARGEEDTGWKNEFRKTLYREIGLNKPDDNTIK